MIIQVWLASKQEYSLTLCKSLRLGWEDHFAWVGGELSLGYNKSEVYYCGGKNEFNFLCIEVILLK